MERRLAPQRRWDPDERPRNSKLSVGHRGSNAASNAARNLPDVAAAASGVACAQNGTGALAFTTGTSIAAPRWAAFTALANERAENAAVEFDVETLRPTYRLQIGQFGMSNALKIARRLKLPRELLKRAHRYLRRKQRRAPELAKLQQLREEAEKARAGALDYSRFVEDRLGDLLATVAAELRRP